MLKIRLLTLFCFVFLLSFCGTVFPCGVGFFFGTASLVVRAFLVAHAFVDIEAEGQILLFDE